MSEPKWCIGERGATGLGVGTQNLSGSRDEDQILRAVRLGAYSPHAERISTVQKQ
jgi:hypothetical protein